MTASADVPALKRDLSDLVYAGNELDDSPNPLNLLREMKQVCKKTVKTFQFDNVSVGLFTLWILQQPSF
jgi:hypothetical protein